MIKYIDTGKTKVIKIKRKEYWCDKCGKKITSSNNMMIGYSEDIRKSRHYHEKCV